VEKVVTAPDFWRGRKVFASGHTGFKGAWLSLWLQHLGAQVTGYALAPPTTPSLFGLADVARGMTSLLADVRDLGRLREALDAAQPEIVMHLAAQSLVRRSYVDPVGTYATNVMGTVNLLEAVRHCPSVRVVIIVTSDKCYENREVMHGYGEDEPLGGHDPYSSSKGCAELVTAAYRRSFWHGDTATAVASVRACNVIGGGDWAEDRLVPDAIAAFAARHPVRVRNPHAVRPWQHVLDPLRGYLMLAERLWESPAHFAGAWNFGPDEEDAKPVSWVVERLVHSWGEGASWVGDEGDHPHEAGYLKLDCSKAQAQLGWRPKLDLPQSLDWIVDWHRAQASGANARKLTEEQIGRYEAIRR
jgi:CDP-glucose 4,6-dehydratase